MSGVRSPLLDRRPFISARYTELRTDAVNVLRRACEAFADGKSRELANAIGDGIKVVEEIDALWTGQTYVR